MPSARAAIDYLCERIPGIAIHFIHVRESMRNGGGPACLRLRVPLTPAEQAALLPAIRFTPDLHARLQQWITTHYRETLAPADLRDPALIRESNDALDALRSMGIPVAAE
jgi:succinylarginine dihydrolase